MPPRTRRAEIIDVEPVEVVERKWEVDLDELDAQITEAIGSGTYKIRLHDDTAIEVRPAVLLSDDRTAAWMRVEAGEDLDLVENRELRSELAAFLDADTLDRVWKLVEPNVQVRGRTINGELAAPQHIRMARAILGEADYGRLVAGGGSSYRVMWAFQKMNDAMSGEAQDPKLRRSSQ